VTDCAWLWVDMYGCVWYVDGFDGGDILPTQTMATHRQQLVEYKSSMNFSSLRVLIKSQHASICGWNLQVTSHPTNSISVSRETETETHSNYETRKQKGGIAIYLFWERAREGGGGVEREWWEGRINIRYTI
jgi:hypothetical protein